MTGDGVDVGGGVFFDGVCSAFFSAGGGGLVFLVAGLSVNAFFTAGARVGEATSVAFEGLRALQC